MHVQASYSGGELRFAVPLVSFLANTGGLLNHESEGSRENCFQLDVRSCPSLASYEWQRTMRSANSLPLEDKKLSSAMKALKARVWDLDGGLMLSPTARKESADAIRPVDKLEMARLLLIWWKEICQLKSHQWKSQKDVKQRSKILLRGVIKKKDWEKPFSYSSRCMDYQ